MPFTYGLNPYRGCEFGCRDCYARYTHEFMELHDSDSFENQIYAKRNVGVLHARELHKVKPGESIAIGTATVWNKLTLQQTRATAQPFSLFMTR